MSVLIKSMDMPTECEYCGFCRYYPENGNVWCNAKNRLLKMNWEKPHWTHLDVKRPDWCPLEELPSVQPERMRGKWIKRSGTINCSICKHSNWSECFEDTVMSFNFCPNCGAKMER